MCGIAGALGGCNEAAVRRMVAAMAHRGPDDEGMWNDPDGRATMGHRRLSIIDLSPAGHQPMSYRDDRLWIVFNGEIYNYRELRIDLEARGHVFRSHTDTEVILAAYAEWGPACVDRLTGMFAFAIVDRRPPPGRPDFVLARDRFGIKPLLYASHGPTLLFASELRAMMASGLVGRRVSLDGLKDFLLFGSAQQPETILQGVTALPPGCRLEIAGERQSLVPYWDLHTATASLREELRLVTEPEALDRLDTELRAATRRHLIADVPVGSFLSGGLDSSLITALMSRESGRTVSTFTVGFERSHAAFDERKYALDAARHLGCAHYEELVLDSDLERIFDAAIRAMDRPSVDGVNSWIVARAAARHVKVALSGLGGDELFAGYPHFSMLRDVAQRNPHGNPIAYALWSRLRRHTSIGPWGFGRLIAAASPDARLPIFRTAARPGELRSAFRGRRHAVNLSQATEHYRTLYPLDGDEIQRVSYAETRGYLLNMLLRDADAMSMAHSLELRPVFLDHVLAEFTYALPGRLKVANRTHKALLKRYARDLLPPHIIDRPKIGFTLPFVTWLQQSPPLRARFIETMASPAAGALFNNAYREAIVRDLRDNRPVSPAVWGWATLLTWLDNERCELPDL